MRTIHNLCRHVLTNIPFCTEILQAPTYNDISVAQWLGLTPKQVVKDHLGFSEETLDRLPQVKPFILPGDPDLSKTNFTETGE